MIVDPTAPVSEDYDDESDGCDEDECCPSLHMIPECGKLHEASWDCWCQPEAEWDGGVPVWVHRMFH